MNFFRALNNLLRFDRTNWKALTLCLFAASVFWIFNALNKSYSTNFRVPIQFEFDKEKFVAIEPLPPTLSLNVTGNGWELLRKSLGLKAPLVTMPLERPAETRKIVASSLAPIVASQMGTLKLNYIVTDTLRLKIEPTIQRKVLLLANLSGVSYKKDFGQIGPVTIVPDCVTLEGPKTVLEKIKDTIYLNLNSSRVAANVKENVEIIVSNDLISRNPPVAEVQYEVGTVEQITRYIKLFTPKAPWGTEIADDSVRCLFMVPQKDRERFLAKTITLVLSLENETLVKGQTKKFLPQIKGLPEYATLQQIDSVKVKKY